jgi:hypothetical protein
MPVRYQRNPQMNAMRSISIVARSRIRRRAVVRCVT